MPNLESTAVAAWARERNVADVESLAHNRHRSIEDDKASCETLAQLGTLLDVAQMADPARLSTVLRTDPVIADLRAMLAQLEPTQMLRFSVWLFDTNLPERDAVLGALFGPDPSGLGQALRTTSQSLHRRALLASIFHPGRVQALRRACRTTAKETT